MQTTKVRENMAWYLSGLDDMKCSFNSLSLRSYSLDKPEWTFIWNSS